jgi:hypothetical protein
MQDLRTLADELKSTVRSVLGDVPSQIFLGRVDKVIDEGMSDIESLRNASVKVENLVKLFIGVEESKVIGRRFREVLDRTA